MLEHLITSDDNGETYEPRIEHIPVRDSLVSKPNEHEQVRAKLATVAMMGAYGQEATLDEEDAQVAQSLFSDHAAQKRMDLGQLTQPGMVIKLGALLSEYDHEIIKDAQQIRTFVKNRLLEEAAPEKPAGTRLKALDMLGKITEVGLFTDRSEVTIKMQPIENLEQQLHEKLQVLLPEEYDRILHGA